MQELSRIQSESKQKEGMKDTKRSPKIPEGMTTENPVTNILIKPRKSKVKEPSNFNILWCFLLSLYLFLFNLLSCLLLDFSLHYFFFFFFTCYARNDHKFLAYRVWSDTLTPHPSSPRILKPCNATPHPPTALVFLYFSSAICV